MGSIRRLREISASRPAPVSRGGPRLDLPFGRGPARHCFDAGLPSAGRQAVTKARSARQCCGRQFDGGPSALSLGCRRHHGRREAETWTKGCVSVVYYTVLRRETAEQQTGLWRAPGAMERWGASSTPSSARLRDKRPSGDGDGRVAMGCSSHAHPRTRLAAGFVPNAGASSPVFV